MIYAEETRFLGRCRSLGMTKKYVIPLEERSSSESVGRGI